jgi:hypothetical protein
VKDNCDKIAHPPTTFYISTSSQYFASASAHHTNKSDEDDGRTRRGEPAARARLSLGVARQGESVAGIILGFTYYYIFG